MNNNGGLMEQKQATEQWIGSWDETMEVISQKIDSRFEELIELLRSMNGNSAASTSADSGVVGGGAPVREESREGPKSADSQENGGSRKIGSGSGNISESRIEDYIDRSPDDPIQESATLPQIGGDFTEQEISFDYSLSSIYWKLEESAISKAMEVPQHLVIDDTEEQERQKSDIGDVVGMQWLQEGIAKPSLQVLELAKVKSGSSETPSVDYISANLGGLVELLIELMEIRLANANKISRTGLRMDSTVSLRNLISAHKVFAKMTDYTVVLFESKKCLGQLKSDRNLALDDQCCYLDLARGMVLVYDPGGDFDVLDYKICEAQVIGMVSTGLVDYNSPINPLFSIKCVKDRLFLMSIDRGKAIANSLGGSQWIFVSRDASFPYDRGRLGVVQKVKQGLSSILVLIWVVASRWDVMMGSKSRCNICCCWQV